jgi:hypothetical protein
MGAYENSLAIPEVPPMSLLNVFGVELGNKWTYKGTNLGQPYVVEREFVAVDQSRFPAKTFEMQIKENGTIVGTEWYEDTGSRVNLWGGTYEDEGEYFTMTFSEGLKAAWYPMNAGDHAYSAAIAYILGIPFNVSLTADIVNKADIALGFDTVEAYEMRYQLHIWGKVGKEVLDVTDNFTWWMAPYLGVVKDQDPEYSAKLTSFAIGGGVITDKSDADGDMVSDYNEIFIYHTHWQYKDSDGDGLPDGDEINLHETDPLDADTDHDGMTDGWEVLYDGLDPLIPDASGDPDKDRYTNYEEFLLGSDPADRNDPRPRALPWLPLLLE